MELKFLKKKKKFKKGGSDIKPDLYWRYVLFITLILVLIACAFGLYLFMGMNKEPVVDAANPKEENLIKKERINQVLEFFKEREKKSNEILNSPSPIIDPSL